MTGSTPTNFLNSSLALSFKETPPIHLIICCVFMFIKYKHSVCWWKLAISAGCLSSACQYQYKLRKPTRDKLLMMCLMNRFSRLQTTQPTSGVAVTAVTNCCANCVEPLFWQDGYADSLDGWRCSSQNRMKSRLIHVRHLQTNESGFAISAINIYMLGRRYP